MNALAEKTVRELAVDIPAAPRIFEKLGIDYCCGGSQTLEEACQVARVPLEEAVASLVVAGQTDPATREQREWKAEPLADLIEHIRSTHHKYTREEIARLCPLFDKVCSVHGEKHPELHHLRETFSGLAEELATHMMKEEMVLFPYVERMETAVIRNEPLLPMPFGSVQNPVGMMMHDHDAAGEALRELRRTSHDHNPPPDACGSYQALYQALAVFEADLHQHIHLENNILFPRAVAMERSR
jgi:regulator of cell morphogenesis and NO signaling